jgi:hypothetical protein
VNYLRVAGMMQIHLFNVKRGAIGPTQTEGLRALMIVEVAPPKELRHTRFLRKLTGHTAFPRRFSNAS